MAGFQQLRVTREVDFTGATKIGFGGYPYLTGGNVFYVDNAGTAGDDGHLGTNPDYPKDTITSALASCTDDNHDYIFVLDCYHEGATITINKSTCHVIGVSMPTTWGWAALDGEGSDVIQIADNYIELAGFHMISASADGIHFTAGGYQWVHHCGFAVVATDLVNAIECDSTFPTNATIEDCTFGQLTTCITGNGIEGAGNALTIRRNRFKAIAGIAINMGASPGGYICDNLFAIEDDVNGEAITLAVGTVGNLVTNNIAVNGILNTGYTYNPYRDLAATNTANHWGMNYRGNAVIEPVGV